jgi:mRNA deadenylase 3'-5' endonuclease subunit Ccr4
MKLIKYTKFNCINMDFRVVTWNILAKQYFKTEDYKHLEEKDILILADWDKRKDIILKFLKKLNVDIILLQEVTLDTFDVDFTDLFTEYAYIRHENNKHRRNPIGNVILFRKSIFTLIESHSRTKAIHAKLTFLSQSAPEGVSSDMKADTTTEPKFICVFLIYT